MTRCSEKLFPRAVCKYLLSESKTRISSYGKVQAFQTSCTSSSLRETTDATIEIDNGTPVTIAIHENDYLLDAMTEIH